MQLTRWCCYQLRWMPRIDNIRHPTHPPDWWLNSDWLIVCDCWRINWNIYRPFSLWQMTKWFAVQVRRERDTSIRHCDRWPFERFPLAISPRMEELEKYQMKSYNKLNFTKNDRKIRKKIHANIQSEYNDNNKQTKWRWSKMFYRWLGVKWSERPCQRRLMRDTNNCLRDWPSPNLFVGLVMAI